VHERLRNTRIDTYGPFQNTWEWWIPRDRQRERAGSPQGDSAAPDTGGQGPDAAARRDTAR
jgi:hypothetical protein